MLEIKRLNKAFGKKKILENISFQLEIGEIVGIFGSNGSGKSTMLKLIFGTLKADAIGIYINSKTIAPKNVIPSMQIAYLPQETFLPKSSKVRNIIPLFFPDGAEQDKIFYSKGVASFENKTIGKLSSGQLRYLEILLIGHLKHPYLLLDEPFSMLEPLYKEFIKDFLIHLKQKKGLLITDHYYNDVLDVTDKNYILKNGKIIKMENTQDLVKYEYLNSSPL